MYQRTKGQRVFKPVKNQKSLECKIPLLGKIVLKVYENEKQAIRFY